MNLALIDRIRRLRRTVAGRLIQVTVDVQRIAGERNHPAIVPYADRAEGLARRYIDLRTRRDAQRNARSDGKAGEIDTEVDIYVGLIHEAADRFFRRMPNSAKGKAGQRILRAYFRRGLAAVISIPYEDELVLVEYIHEGLIGPHAEDVRTLAVGPHVESLGALLPQYRDALAIEDRISATEVAEAYEAMQVAYFRMVFAIASAVPSDEDAESLLDPVFEQDDRLAAVYAARRAGQSVAGAIDDPDAEAEAILDAELAEAEARDAEDREAAAEAEQPAAEQPAAEQPAAEQPAAEQPPAGPPGRQPLRRED